MAASSHPSSVPRQSVQPTFHIGPRGGPGAGLHLSSRPKNAQGTLRRLWTYLQRQRWGLLAVILLTLLTTALSLARPVLDGPCH